MGVGAVDKRELDGGAGVAAVEEDGEAGAGVHWGDDGPVELDAF